MVGRDGALRRPRPRDSGRNERRKSHEQAAFHWLRLCAFPNLTNNIGMHGGAERGSISRNPSGRRGMYLHYAGSIGTVPLARIHLPLTADTQYPNLAGGSPVKRRKRPGRFATGGGVKNAPV